MTSFKKFVMAFGLFAVMAMPLAGCSGTWQGMKNDWHDVTGSNDNGAVEERTASQANEEPARTAEPAADSMSNDAGGPSAYN